ncbi:PQQ-dependent sugar dehydrogenase [Rubricoccus marinus]|uniref:Glucose/Sorbosone dehydrogenase domain-containing protein n=1 Tax=Rubricoccus marinus TaxID=716817 RepID=A0A259TV39_9BACT|nr:PQQ-dependent sugar dehydrogenase [Rubricoccus marinus]OZC01632.1 hypothetical protein BSZ36_00725 [Rubricoccus marinus]
MPRFSSLTPLAVFGLTLLLAAAPEAQITATNAFPGVSFQSPVEMGMAPGQPNRVYVVEQGNGTGRARILTLEVGDSAPTVFLDLDDRVRAGGEQGLLGLAFHPNYAANGRVFVHYSGQPDGRTVVSEFARASGDPLAADPESERVILERSQPFGNHNGGKIAFGPDGFLYIGLGDGGSGNDPLGSGQDTSTILGALLRIDVDTVPAGATYGIPVDNPFASGGGRGEIYAYGIRNPWKFSFDSLTGDLWLGDVGQGRWEEINKVRNGGNYGWNRVEGPECFQRTCTLSDYDAPVFSYPHNNTDQGGLSITGGIVYRGTDVAGLEGAYLYADFVFPRLWSLFSGTTPGTATSTLLSSSISNISSINEGPGREAYVVTYGGTIFRLQGTSTAAAPGASGAGLIRVDGPNPVRGEAALVLSASGGEPVRVRLFDARGRELAVLNEGAVAREMRLVVDLETLGVAAGVVFVLAETSTLRQSVRLVVTG